MNISNGWFCQFIERQPALSLRKGHISSLDNKEAIENYFKLANLKEVLAEYGQFNEPSQIYNVDESGMPQIIVHLMLW